MNTNLHIITKKLAMNTLDKVWVHLRFFLKFVSLQLFSFLLTFYGALLLFVMWLFFNFSLLFVIITLLAIPLAIIEEKYVKTRLLWFIRDDTRLDKSRGSGFAEVSHYDEEWALNESKRTIKVIRPSKIRRVVAEFERVMSDE